MDSRIYFMVLLGVIIAIYAPSCSEQDEGCLDIYANNFQASADENCCCTYPDLVLQLDHRYDTLAFRRDSVYMSDAGMPYKVQDIGMMLSSIHPMIDETEYDITDTLHISKADGTLLELENNFLWVKPSLFEYTIGDFPKPDTYTGLSMRWGLPDEVDGVQPTEVYQENHPLASDADSTWNADEGYFYFYMEVVPDTSQSTVRTIIMNEDDGDLMAGWTHTQNTIIAENAEWKANLDYKILFSNIDFVADDKATMIQKLKQNFPNAWIFEE